MPKRGSFVPLTDFFNVQRIAQVNVNSDEFKDLIVQLYRSVGDIASVLNVKDTGYYLEDELISGQLFPPDTTLSSMTQQKPVDRPVFRKTINFGTLPNAGSTSVAHGLDLTNTALQVTRFYGAATDPTTGLIPLPFSSPTLNENIKLEADNTNVIITTGIDYSGYTECWVVLEYLKQ